MPTPSLHANHIPIKHHPTLTPPHTHTQAIKHQLVDLDSGVSNFEEQVRELGNAQSTDSVPVIRPQLLKTFSKARVMMDALLSFKRAGGNAVHPAPVAEAPTRPSSAAAVQRTGSTRDPNGVLLGPLDPVVEDTEPPRGQQGV